MKRLLHVLFFVLAAGALPAQSVASFRKGEWRSQDVPQGYVSKSIGRYQIQSNCPPEIIERIGKHMNAMFKVYSKHFPSQKTPKFNLVIKLFQNRKLFLDYGASESSAGHYDHLNKEMVAYYTGKMGGVMEEAPAKTTGDPESDESPFKNLRKRMTIDTMGVYSHEGWHQYFHWSCGSHVPFPAWGDEGIGEYYYPCWMKGDTLIMGAPNDIRLATIQSAIAAKKHVPLKEFVHYEQQEYYRNAGICYAEGWSFVHFLFEHPAYAPKEYVQKFVTVFRDQHSIQKTLDIVFKGVDLDALEKEWIDWTMAITPVPDDDDFLDLSEKQRNRAKEYQARLPEKVRKALLACIERRQFKEEPRPASKPASAPASQPASAPASQPASQPTSPSGGR